MPKTNLIQVQTNKYNTGQRVIVAMSGGVDSSVAAALLKKQGFDVAGVFMRFWGETRNGTDKDTEFNGNTCCSEGAEKAARAVAAKLKIPFYVFNFEKEFKKAVVDHFLNEQKRGRTPNPCVVCNKKIKFGLMFERAMGRGADFLATGHYARVTAASFVIPPPHLRGRNLARMGVTNLTAGMRQRSFAGAQDDETLSKLFAAKDINKDQSYFLYNLNQKQLGKIIFPVGDYEKEEVYRLAKKWRLPYRKEESFDLCFVASDTESFLRRYLKMKPGKILRYTPHLSPFPFKGEGRGEVLGQHDGLALYTIGQRKNIPVQKGPWWVVKKDENRNILYVSNKEKDLYGDKLIVSQVNWLSGRPPKLPMKVWAKIRYKSEVNKVTLRRTQGKNQLELIFEIPQRAITPGQSVVFYAKNGQVLGGGVTEQ